jgi:Pentapeptide repeats (8 copies)
VANGPSRTRLFRLTAPLGLVAAALVMWAGPAQARPAKAQACPTVDPSTGAVSPAPGPGVQWAGCDLTGADLAGANLTGATLKGLDLGSADLTDANLTNAQLMEAILSDATLTGATLTGVSSGYISGTPSSLPSDWIMVNNYLIGPGASLRYAG